MRTLLLLVTVFFSLISPALAAGSVTLPVDVRAVVGDLLAACGPQLTLIVLLSLGFMGLRLLLDVSNHRIEQAAWRSEREQVIFNRARNWRQVDGVYTMKDSALLDLEDVKRGYEAGELRPIRRRRRRRS